MIDELKARIEKLEAEKANFIRQADAQIAAINGGISELKRLIEKLEADTGEDDTGEDADV